jgi:hypothetical protein
LGAALALGSGATFAGCDATRDERRGSAAEASVSFFFAGIVGSWILDEIEVMKREVIRVRFKYRKRRTKRISSDVVMVMSKRGRIPDSRCLTRPRMHIITIIDCWNAKIKPHGFMSFQSVCCLCTLSDPVHLRGERARVLLAVVVFANEGAKEGHCMIWRARHIVPLAASLGRLSFSHSRLG